MEKQITEAPRKESDHFRMIFWFIVGLTLFGAFLSVFLIVIFPKDTAARFGDTALIFWLSTAVSGGIGYLIGSSVQKVSSTPTTTGTVTADISVSGTTDSK